MLNKTTDIKRSIIPITSEPIATSVEGIEKYLVSLKMVITTVEKATPKIIKTKPGIPRNLRGRFSAISSISEVRTSVV